MRETVARISAPELREAFYSGNSVMDKTYKGKNVVVGKTLVALVVDDLPSTDPRIHRSIKIHGIADFVERELPARRGGGSGTYIRVRGTRSWSFGILSLGFQDGRWITAKLTWSPPE